MEDITQVTIIDKNGKSTVVDVTKLPPTDPTALEIKELNDAIGFQVNGKVIKKEQ